MSAPEPPEPEQRAVDRSEYPTRRLRMRDGDDDRHIRGLTPAERMAMVWQLTLDAWAFRGGLDDEPRVRRDIVRVIRLGE